MTDKGMEVQVGDMVMVYSKTAETCVEARITSLNKRNQTITVETHYRSRKYRKTLPCTSAWRTEKDPGVVAYGGYWANGTPLPRDERQCSLQ